MTPKEELKNFRFNIKERIANTLVDLYKSNNNGLLPNWENEEEVVVTEDEVGTLKIDVCVMDSHDYYREVEEQVIVKYIVTLDYNLFFVCGENEENEIEWQDISTDDLVGILTHLEYAVKLQIFDDIRFM